MRISCHGIHSIAVFTIWTVKHQSWISLPSLTRRVFFLSFQIFQLKLFFSLLSKSDFFESGFTNSSDSNIDPRSLPHQRSRCHISKNMTPASHEKTQNQTKLIFGLILKSMCSLRGKIIIKTFDFFVWHWFSMEKRLKIFKIF